VPERNPAIDAFFEKALTYEENDCFIWPFGRDSKGRARWERLESTYLTTHVSRAICMEIYGNPPTDKHQAAHSCSNGHLGCINPKHLRWATQIENSADDQRGEDCSHSKLTEEHILEIRKLSRTMTSELIAKKYNVSRPHISRIINRKRWSWLEEPCDAQFLFDSIRPKLNDLFA
jgi:hypothetical protein